VSVARRTTSGSQEASRQVSWTGLLHLFVVYLVWGSTYLAIRVAVREGSGFPPFTLAASRAILGGLALLVWTALGRNRLRLTGREAVILAVSGLLLWTGGNGLVVWAEQRIHSAYAALLVSTTPIWAALIESVIDRRVPSALLILAQLVGFCGAALLAVPILAEGVTADTWAVIGLILASFSWASGSIYQNRNPVKLAARTSAAYQQLFGSVGFIALVLATGEPTPNPTVGAWWAWGYLVIFGSILAFTSFVQALRLLPTGIVFTYGYVNPLIAVVLGWLVLDEPITRWTLAGAAFILAGVAGVFRDRVVRARRRPAAIDAEITG
jgi:drug/metabolite transporter (DMT)-like permease